MTPFESLAKTSLLLRATRARSAKAELLSTFLRTLEPGEIGAAVGLLSGSTRFGKVGIGYTTLGRVEAGPAEIGALPPSIQDVERELEGLAERTPKDRDSALARLFARLSLEGRGVLSEIVTDGPRQGGLEGLMIAALARAFGTSEGEIRRGVMMSGSVWAVAAALASGEGVPPELRTLVPGRPVRPMLAEAAKSPEEALTNVGGEALADVKIDGVRVQIHCTNGHVQVFSRALADLGERLASAVRVCLSGLDRDCVLDAEIALVDAADRPFAFQDTMSALGEGWAPGPDQRLRLFVFDVLALGGEVLVDRPLRDRRSALVSVVGQGAQVASRTVASPEEARRAYDDALAEGHEGIVLKRLDSPYVAGARDAAWFKVKKAETADLVVLAAEWGSGRRRGYLSNLHLGARARASGEDGHGFVMVGKTFKGMTDAMLAQQTERLLELETAREGGPDFGVVHVRPGLVAEVAYSDVQRSARYPGGVALRLARVVRYRDDKAPAEATSIDELRRALPRAPEAVSREKKRGPPPSAQLSLFGPRGDEAPE